MRWGQRHPSSSKFVAEEEGEAAAACSVVTAATRLDMYGATKIRDVLGSLENGDCPFAHSFWDFGRELRFAFVHHPIHPVQYVQQGERGRNGSHCLAAWLPASA